MGKTNIQLGANPTISAIVGLFAVITVCGCSGTTESLGGDQVARLGVNHPTNVDVVHDVPVPRDKILEIEVDFAHRNQAQFDELMREIDDRSSPQYHHWLTPEEAHARFGETAEQFNAAEQWLRDEGFTITERRYGANSDYLRARGTAAQIEKTFKLRLVEPMYDRYINSKDPAIPPQFVGVISRVSGLYGLLP